MIGKTNSDLIGLNTEKSILLPAPPQIILSVQMGHIVVSWTQPASEATVDHYNVYYSVGRPQTLKDMTKVGTTKGNTFDITPLANDVTYYVSVQAVNPEGYENASIVQMRDGTPCALRFICTRQGGGGYYSTDGINWAPLNGLNSHNHPAIAYGKGKFVFGGWSYDMCYSLDGINCIQAASSLVTLKSIVWGEDRFVGIGADSSNVYFSIYSFDGINWVKGSSIPYTTVDITYGNGKFLVVGSEAFGGRVFSSVDGVNWEKVAEMSWNLDTYNPAHINAITFGRDKFVIVGSSGQNYYSTDGINWTRITSLTASGYNDVVFGSDRWVAVGRSSSPEVFYSFDGINWDKAPTFRIIGYPSAITYGAGRFVLVGNSEINAWYSDNGVNWAPCVGIDQNASFENVACTLSR